LDEKRLLYHSGVAEYVWLTAGPFPYADAADTASFHLNPPKPFPWGDEWVSVMPVPCNTPLFGKMGIEPFNGIRYLLSISWMGIQWG
jgi:hypothetical protein